MCISSPAMPNVTATGKDVRYEEDFYYQLFDWAQRDGWMARRIVGLIEQTILTPGEGTGRPKKLAHVPGGWSRRITRHHRLIYVIEDDELRFVSCYGHEVPGHLYGERGD